MRCHEHDYSYGDWIRNAAEADTYHTRISQGWDRYGLIAVPRPRPER
ncbi:hypothetical protein ACFQ6Q_16680 [Streptomyces sp. NPDC056437]